MSRSRRIEPVPALILLVGCTERGAAPDAAAAERDAFVVRDAAMVRPDSGQACGCAPGVHVDRVLVLSDDRELWAFDPVALSFERLRGNLCETAERPYSMAIDALGRVHVLFAESRAIRVFDLASPSASCTGSGLDPSRIGFDLYGLAFAREPATACDSLYLHSYSGSGPFDEGEDVGVLGVADTRTLEVRALAPIDYNGGELAGTGDGRLFALAGIDPAKVVQYERGSGAVIETLPLTGFSKTNASAMAFYGGSLWLFTEALPAGCEECLGSSCEAARDACEASPSCARELGCLLETARPTDACGGGLPGELVACVTEACGSVCGIRPADRVSRVSRLAWDGDRSLTSVLAQAPIRIVGAGTSPCVTTFPF